MEKIYFCSVCGRVLEESFLFCPYCGEQRISPLDFGDLLEEPFRKMETQSRTFQLERLNNLAVRLDKLENELNWFLYKKLCISKPSVPKSK